MLSALHNRQCLSTVCLEAMLLTQSPGCFDYVHQQRCFPISTENWPFHSDFYKFWSNNLWNGKETQFVWESLSQCMVLILITLRHIISELFASSRKRPNTTKRDPWMNNIRVQFSFEKLDKEALTEQFYRGKSWNRYQELGNVIFCLQNFLQTVSMNFSESYQLLAYVFSFQQRN